MQHVTPYRSTPGLLAANPRAADLGGCARPAERTPRRDPAQSPRVAQPVPRIDRPAWVVLAQFETGHIAAIVTSNPDDWREEAVRLQQVAFGRFAAYVFASVDAAREAIDALGREIHAQFGAHRANLDQRLAKTFLADWPIVLDTFTRQNKMRVAA